MGELEGLLALARAEQYRCDTAAAASRCRSAGAEGQEQGQERGREGREERQRRQLAEAVVRAEAAEARGGALRAQLEGVLQVGSSSSSGEGMSVGGLWWCVWACGRGLRERQHLPQPRPTHPRSAVTSRSRSWRRCDGGWRPSLMRGARGSTLQVWWWWCVP